MIIVFENTQAGKSNGIISLLVFTLLGPQVCLNRCSNIFLMLFWVLMGQSEDEIKIIATANVTLILNNYCHYCLLPL